MIKGGPGGLLLDTGAGPSFLPLPTAILEQIAAGNSEPGVTTIRIVDLLGQQLRSTIDAAISREIDIEVCFVCKKCRIAFAGESSLLAHQRQCFVGNLDGRGSFRVVQTGYECKMCGGDRYQTQQDLKKHFESEQHLKIIKGTSIASGTSMVITQSTTTTPTSTAQLCGGSTLPPPSESPLSHEMEDVVNQITLLAARAAAQESGPDTVRGLDTNSNNFCQPSEPKRRFLSPADVVQPLTSAGH